MRSRNRQWPRARMELEWLEKRELLNATDEVKAFYKDVLSRPPDISGLSQWTKLLDDGTSPTAVALAVVQSHEAHADFVQQAYQHILGRIVDPLGLANFTAYVDAGGLPQQIEADLLGSNEYSGHFATDAAFLNSLYRAELH